MRRSVLAAAFACALAAPLPAFAQQANDNSSWDGGFGKKGQRRSDFVLAFSPGLVLTSADGYPNEIAKLGDPRYEATSGAAFGPGFEAWFGGAFTDWFTFGLGGAYFSGSGSKGKTTGGAALIRVETFPLFGLGGGWRDLAVFANFGPGGLGIDGNDRRHAASGLASVGGGGVAYELARVGHFAFAPSAEYLLIASQTLTSHQALIGLRAVFYGGPATATQ